MAMTFEQQPKESAKAFAAFALYLSMGPERSLAMVAQKLHKSVTMLGRWSAKFDWPARVQAHALLRQGDLWGARDSLEASLAARERKELFEATLTMLSLIELDRLEGVEPPLEMVNETRNLLASRKVRAVPPVPSPPQ